MMKIITYLMILTLSLSAIDITDIIESIEKMNTSAKIPKTIEYDLYDPFSGTNPILNDEKNKIKKTNNIVEAITLQTILNNRAFIDGKWYNEGDKVREFKIETINSDSVVLVQNSKKTTLRFKMIESILEMKEQEE